MKKQLTDFFKKASAVIMAGAIILSISPVNTELAEGSAGNEVHIGFDTIGASNASGISVQFDLSHVSGGGVNAQNQTNAYDNTFVPAGVTMITITSPTNIKFDTTVIDPSVSITGVRTANITKTAGTDLNITFKMVNDGAAPPSTSSNISISFNNVSGVALGSIGFDIIGAKKALNQTNMYSDTNYPPGSSTVITSIPANTMIGPNTDPNPDNAYQVQDRNTITFTSTAGKTHVIVINIISTSSQSSNLTLSFDASSSTIAGASNISFDLTGAATVLGTVLAPNTTYTNPSYPIGTTLMTAALPAGTRIVGGAGYTVIDDRTATFGTTSGGTHTIVFTVQDGSTPPPGGGGGGRRRHPQAPTITFTNNVDKKDITALTVTVGQKLDVGVTSRDTTGFFGAFLEMSTDPTKQLVNKASFAVKDQGTMTATGLLDWTPQQSNIGKFDFVFKGLSGGLESEAILPITVNPVTSGGGGGGTNADGEEDENEDEDEDELTLEERIKNCTYSDNASESVIFLCLLGVIDPPTNDLDYYEKSKEKKFFSGARIDRAAFTKIMINITYSPDTIDRIGELVVKNQYSSFSDVNPNDWYAKYIAIAKLDDHVQGYPGTDIYAPQNSIKISEAVKILFNTARNDNDKISQDIKNEEKKIGADAPWFLKFANLAYKYGGYTPNMKLDLGKLYHKDLTRQKAADLIYTTIQNAGIETESNVSRLLNELNKIQEEITDSALNIEFDTVNETI